ncbi:hypothetical protein Trco_003224 [Trichoderma cornu-damae]|uniref:Prion-inhibition and propagation HeLo domain-containing protein n=1 Tax=Trichoderma cornu-damae TaxID=654480 RepID=A0A9P8TYS2_9HYPO|nr:hypothetical protein Trco_003224 [Trichoderma cornu-damae]
MSADYDKIVGFFDFTHRFFERLSMIEDKIPQQKPFQCCVARVFSNMLTICSVAQDLVDGSDRALSVAVRNMEDAVNELTQVVGLTTFRTAKILGEVVQSMNENVEDIISNVTLIGKRTGTIKLDTETIIEQNSGLESKQDALLEMQKEALEKLNEQSRIFNDTVQNFGYVQMGANFGNDFQTSLLKLDVVRLRLARWGQSVGLANVDDVKSVHKVKLALENSEQVRGFLDQVLDLFADAEVASKRFEKRNGNSAAPALDPSEELDSVSASLHQKMQDLVERRQGKMELEQRKWTLYEKKNFSRLTDDISELVDGLIDLFPGLHEDQRKLCEEEVSEMKASKGVLSLLKEVAVDQDKMLSDTIAKATQSTTTYNNNVIFSGSNTGFQIGNNLGEISNVRFGRL